jgi:hypothetical protein
LDKNCPFGIRLSLRINILPKWWIEKSVDGKIGKGSRGRPLEQLSCGVYAYGKEDRLTAKHEI